MLNRSRGVRAACAFALLVGLLSGESALARNFELKGNNELSGGFGFAAGLSDWAPGGFKWFNDYGRRLNNLVWLNLQFNVTIGGPHGRDYDCRLLPNGHWDCGYYNHFGGYALEFGGGVKLKWRLRNIPLQIHAKIGGVFDVLFFDYDWTDDVDFTGFAIAFRGGVGVRYFIVPTFGVGAELVLPTIGLAWVNHDVGAELYATLDFNTGIEWRF